MAVLLTIWAKIIKILNSNLKYYMKRIAFVNYISMPAHKNTLSLLTPN